MEDASVAFSTHTLLNGNLDREDIAIFVQSNDFSWSSAKQVGLLSLLVAAQEGVMLHAEWWRHQHGHVLAFQLWTTVPKHGLDFLQTKQSVTLVLVLCC